MRVAAQQGYAGAVEGRPGPAHLAADAGGRLCLLLATAQRGRRRGGCRPRAYAPRSLRRPLSRRQACFGAILGLALGFDFHSTKTSSNSLAAERNPAGWRARRRRHAPRSRASVRIAISPRAPCAAAAAPARRRR